MGSIAERTRTEIARGVVRIVLHPTFSPRTPLKVQRAVVGSIGRTTPLPGARMSPISLAGVAAESVVADGPEPERTMVYLHGGGYVLGGIAGWHALAARLARAARAEVILLDYRLAPEHPFPAAREDVLAAWRELGGRRDGRSLMLGGDSAGGGLSVSAALAMRDAGLPAPSALVLISPWLDLTLSGETIDTHARIDPVLSPGALHRWARLYAGGRELTHPGVSPLFADLDGLPPALIQVGGDEILLADSERFAERLGPDRCRLEREHGLWHDYQAFAHIVPAAARAIERAGAWLRDVVPAGGA